MDWEGLAIVVHTMDGVSLSRVLIGLEEFAI